MELCDIFVWGKTEIYEPAPVELLERVSGALEACTAVSDVLALTPWTLWILCALWTLSGSIGALVAMGPMVALDAMDAM